MGKIKIYIDHIGSDEDKEFAKRLKDRINSIKYDFEVQIYSELDFDRNDGTAWELATVTAIDSATIVIPVISEGYISFVSEKVEGSFNAIIDSSDRFFVSSTL